MDSINSLAQHRGIASITLYLRQSIGEKYFMEKRGEGLEQFYENCVNGKMLG